MSRPSFTALVAAALLTGFGLAGALRAPRSASPAAEPRPLAAGWGIDACLSVHVDAASRARWLRTLRAARLTYLRERSPGSGNPASAVRGPIAAYRELQRAGYRVLAFGETPGVRPAHPWNALPEDLLAVYWASRKLAQALDGAVSVWELPNEPDTMYCRDLPDRVVAYCKAAYLGLRDGAAESPARRLSPAPPAGVLMSALGNFPGPWLERAAENGLFDYTDGLNVHFYGHARDLEGALRAHQAFASRWVADRKLPLWVTECGINSVPMTDVAEARGREIQRAFAVETAATARRVGAAVFMPFVLVWPKEEWFAMAHSPTQPYPAWTAYAAFTRANSLPAGPALAPPTAPPRIVLQWLPDNETCVPHKVSGSYWFRGDPREPEPISAQLVIYNLSGEEVRGRWDLDAPPTVAVVDAEGRALSQAEISVPPFGKVAVPMRVLSRARAGGAATYARSAIRLEFQAPGMSQARAVTWVETRPAAENLRRRLAVTGTRPEADAFQWIWAPEPFAAASAAGGPWLGVNGVRVLGSEDRPATDDLAKATRFLVEERTGEPRRPPMAITRVAGLPDEAGAFLRLRFPNGKRTPGGVRVDLVDDKGQRFSVAEDLGRNRFRVEPDEARLAFADFHIYAWGRCTEDPRFRPEAIREIQLRFYPVTKRARIPLALEIVRP